MRLLLKQRFLSWFDCYNIYRLPPDATADYDFGDDDIAFVVEGQLAWGHEFHVSDRSGQLLGQLSQRLFTWLPKFDIYVGGELIGCVEKEFSLFTPSFRLDFRGWTVEGDFFEWDYTIRDSGGRTIARISKELFYLTDTYIIDVEDEREALCALMVVLAIDAEKCSRG